MYTDPFKEDYAELSQQMRRRVQKQLGFLLLNPRHPSLRARIVDKKRRIWKAKVNGGYRFTFQIEGQFYILRRIGSHEEMLRRERW